MNTVNSPELAIFLDDKIIVRDNRFTGSFHPHHAKGRARWRCHLAVAAYRFGFWLGNKIDHAAPTGGYRW